MDEASIQCLSKSGSILWSIEAIAHKCINADILKADNFLESSSLSFFTTKHRPLGKINKKNHLKKIGSRNYQVIDIYHNKAQSLNFERLYEKDNADITFLAKNIFNEIDFYNSQNQSWIPFEADRRFLDTKESNEFINFFKIENFNNFQEEIREIFDLCKLKTRKLLPTYLKGKEHDVGAKFYTFSDFYTPEKSQSKLKKRGRKKVIIREEIFEFFDKQIDLFRNNKMSINEMREIVIDKYKEISGIKRTCFYLKFLKERGYSYKFAKVRFGNTGPSLKQKSWNINTRVILSLCRSFRRIYFYDEYVFDMQTFNRKNWWRKITKKCVNFNRPCLRMRLNMVTSLNAVIAFELSHGEHKQAHVEEFIRKGMLHVREQMVEADGIMLVLDNGPKNRGKGLWALARSHLFTAVYITPWSPEQNFLEGIFSYIKRRYAKLRALNAINSSADPLTTVARTIVGALTTLTAEDFRNNRRNFCHELSLRATLAYSDHEYLNKKFISYRNQRNVRFSF